MQTILTKIISLIIAPVIFLGTLISPVQAPITPIVEAPTQNVGATLPQATGVFETSLASPISSTATSMTFTSNSVRGGGSVSGYTCFTVDEGSAQAEVICGTVASTAVSSLTRGISYADGITAVAANKFSHRRGANVKITDFPLVQILKAQNNGDATFPNPLVYETGIGPVASGDLTDKEYVLSVVNGGPVSYDQVVLEALAGETISAGQLLYFSETENEWMKTDADTLATLFNVQLGVAMGSGTNGAAITGGVLVTGSYTTSGLTQGDLLYASNTAGGINSGTSGTIPRVIGVAKSTTVITFNPNFQNKLYDYAVDAVGTDAYAITLPGGLSVPYVGMEIVFKAGTANTTGATLAVNGGTAKAIVKDVSTALATGDILANQIVKVVYDGTNFQMVSFISGTLTSQSQTTPIVRTYLNAGSPATWTKPANLKWVIVEVQASGGGGAGGGNATGAGGNGGTGGDVSFGTHATATGGTGGTYNGAGGAGGTAASGDINIIGQKGIQGTSGAGANLNMVGGAGGASGSYGGGGNGGTGFGSGNTGISGGGGGGGGYSKKLIATATLGATETVTIGVTGTAGSAGNSSDAGIAGNIGIVIVTEYYQ